MPDAALPLAGSDRPPRLAANDCWRMAKSPSKGRHQCGTPCQNSRSARTYASRRGRAAYERYITAAAPAGRRADRYGYRADGPRHPGGTSGQGRARRCNGPRAPRRVNLASRGDNVSARHQELEFLPAPHDNRRVPVMLPYPFPGPFDYRIPAGLDLSPGDVVLVPLNRREEIGVVWDGAPATRSCPKAEIGDWRCRYPADGLLAAAIHRLDRRLYPDSARGRSGHGTAGRFRRRPAGGRISARGSAAH